EIRRRIIAETDLPVGSVPLYSAAVETTRKYGDVRKMSKQTLWEKIEEEASGGISFITVHTGVSEKIVRRFQKGRRLINIVSRGGSIIACWILANRKENPLLADFGRLLKIARKYRLTLSLGDGLRPG
ncbi:MAG: phosphomethylpyrimidine synthase, partial [bacterium (Candidatus Ratteibacteria) CG23_combo_of_CG06-09_8_20_14_all_48_7]